MHALGTVELRISDPITQKSSLFGCFFCGKTGIRTLGTRKGTTVFETVPIDRSGIFPWSASSAKQ